MKAMKTSLDHDRVIRMIKDSISLLCKSSLVYDIELNVEGLLGITLDKRDIFLVNINESFQGTRGDSSISEDEEVNNAKQPKRKRRRHKRKKSQRDESEEDSTSEYDIPGVSADHDPPKYPSVPPVSDQMCSNASSTSTHFPGLLGHNSVHLVDLKTEPQDSDWDFVNAKNQDSDYEPYSPNKDNADFAVRRRTHRERQCDHSNLASSTHHPKERHALRVPATMPVSERWDWEGTSLRIKRPEDASMSGMDGTVAHTWDRLPRKRSRCKWHSRSLHKRVDTGQGCLQCETHLCSPDCHFAFHDTQLSSLGSIPTMASVNSTTLPAQECLDGAS